MVEILSSIIFYTKYIVRYGFIVSACYSQGDMFIFGNNRWYFGRDAFSNNTVEEIKNENGKIDLIINDARHGINVWKTLDVWKKALTDNGIIITEEIWCATRQQVLEGELIDKQQVNQARKEGWQIYNFNSIKKWEQPNCLIGYWSKNKLNLEEIDTYKYS